MAYLNFNAIFEFLAQFTLRLYGLFSLRLIGSAMFDATFNLIARVGLPYFLNTERLYSLN